MNRIWYGDKRDVSEILRLSQAENDKVYKATEIYGDVFIHAHEVLCFFNQTKVTGTKDAQSSMIFLSQLRNSLWLGLLSAVRCHVVQSNNIIRYAIESGVFACYALDKTSAKEFGSLSEIEGIEINESVKNKAYNWLNGKYPDISSVIYNFKDSINEHYAHANIFPALCNININDAKKEVVSTFFDNTEIKSVKHLIWWIASIALVFADLYSKASKDYPVVILCPDYSERYKSLYTDNMQFREEHMKTINPSIRKIVEESLKSKSG